MRLTERAFDIPLRIAYFRTSFSLSSLKQLSARFLHHRRAARPYCCTPDTCRRSCLECWSVSLKCWVGRSLKDRTVFFRCMCMDILNYTLDLQYWYHWNVHVLPNRRLPYAIIMQLCSLCTPLSLTTTATKVAMHSIGMGLCQYVDLCFHA